MKRLSLILLVIALAIIATPAAARELPYRTYLPGVANTYEPRTITPLPPLNEFAATVANGDANTLRGVYAPGLFAFAVVQQPQGEGGWVSPESDEVTQFASAAQFGTFGLLAHSHLAGAEYTRLMRNDTIILIFGDGRTVCYRVVAIDRWEVMDIYWPDMMYNPATDEALYWMQIFMRYYEVAGQLTLQTCFEYDGSLAGGRLFVVAERVE